MVEDTQIQVITALEHGAGGSGIVIVRYPNTYTISVGSGLTSSTSTDGSDKITTFTAGSDTISFINMAHYAFLNNDATTGTLKEELNVLWVEMGNLRSGEEQTEEDTTAIEAKQVEIDAKQQEIDNHFV